MENQHSSRKPAAPPVVPGGRQVYDPSFDPPSGRFGDTYQPDDGSRLRTRQTAGAGRVSFRPAGLAARQDRGVDYRYRQGRCPCDPPPAVRAWGGGTGAGCTGATVSCRIPGPLSAVCVASRCTGVAVACAVKSIFGW